MALRFSIGATRYYFTFKFLGLTCFFIILFSKLGLWQYHRAQQKRLLIRAYSERPHQQAVIFSTLFKTEEDLRFYSIHLKGHFDNQHQFLLDNKTFQGRVGYEVYTPFLVEGSSQAILIDRGWVAADTNRLHLPTLKPITGPLSLQGVLNTPPTYFVLGAMTEGKTESFPLRVQYLDLKELSKILGYPLAPYIVWLDPQDSHGFQREWKVTFMGPEKHILYTVQWFAFATCLLVIFLVLNLHREK